MILTKILRPNFFRERYYAQDGEDFLLNKFLNSPKPGFFVDLGSAHPVQANNSYLFYLKGWRGLCVDASPGLHNLYKKYRPKDLFINAFVGRCSATRELYTFNEPFLNTGSQSRKEFLLAKTNYKFKEKILVQQIPLQEILKRNMQSNKTIEFMSLDVEEGELEVLESNDWTRYRPRLIIMEVLNQNREKIGENPTVEFLKRQGYHPFIILPRSVFFTTLG